MMLMVCSIVWIQLFRCSSYSEEGGSIDTDVTGNDEDDGSGNGGAGDVVLETVVLGRWCADGGAGDGGAGDGGAGDGGAGDGGAGDGGAGDGGAGDGGGDGGAGGGDGGGGGRRRRQWPGSTREWGDAPSGGLYDGNTVEPGRFW